MAELKVKSKPTVTDYIVSCPKVVFIVPYRNRPQHKFFFLNYMTRTILPHNSLASEDVEIYFAHQHDQRTFNRGAMKNIGFLAVKARYPDDYKNITFVFNDVDTVPFFDIFDYATCAGVVKHFYGFTYALGGIVAVNGGDFERINGFPNYWGWGMEDKVLQERCFAKNIQIDRRQFYSIGSPEILQFFDGVERLINPADMERSKNDAHSLNGLAAISMLNYKLAKGDASCNPDDLIYLHLCTSKTPSTRRFMSDKGNCFHALEKCNGVIKETAESDASAKIQIYFINTTFFLTGTNFEREKNRMMHYDLRAGANKMAKNYTVDPAHFVATAKTWKNIPTYPNVRQQQHLTDRFGKDRADQIVSQMYYKSNHRGKPSTL